MAASEARRWRLTGRVQGVGFRPFVYRLAQRYRLNGTVQNQVGQVVIEAEGEPDVLDAFSASLLTEAPLSAQPALAAWEPIVWRGYRSFDILPSAPGIATTIQIPPDWDVCDDCKRELNSPENRRYRYPFINCTQCGPRYTLITGLPYDRGQTTMMRFELCADCRAEYDDPLNRRFHAEPLACPVCGPALSLQENGESFSGEAALQAAIKAVQRGDIVAVKGIGGYHLLCDASNPQAIARLRQAKNRPHKPFAVMFPWCGDDGLAQVEQQLNVDALSRALLCDSARPIVLLPRRVGATLPDSIAPGVREVGAILPYSPLHHLLLDGLNQPVIATSANVSGEPVLTDGDDVMARLGEVAQVFLHHNRPIARPADDTVVRVSGGKPCVLRVGRGMAPLEMELPYRLPYPVLAVGGQSKNSIALGWENRAILSPHIGDLDSVRSLAVFEQVIADMQRLYRVTPQWIVCDAHPGYASSRWAQRQTLPVQRVGHHVAHAAALALEQGSDKTWLTFAWDGSGLGEEGDLWGGETLLGRLGNWRRVAHLRTFRLPGGERAAREPWRTGAALCWETGLEPPELTDAGKLLREAWLRQLNTPRTSSAGRLFEGAASLLGLLRHASFEGQAGMYLEQIAEGSGAIIELPLREMPDGLIVLDWQPLLAMLRDTGQSVASRAMQFHRSLAHAIVAMVRQMAKNASFERVGLTGGVFQNKLLLELSVAALREAGFEVGFSEKIPCNDGGLAMGQLVEAGQRIQ